MAPVSSSTRTAATTGARRSSGARSPGGTRRTRAGNVRSRAGLRNGSVRGARGARGSQRSGRTRQTRNQRAMEHVRQAARGGQPPEQIRQYIRDAARAYGADERVLTNMARRESSFRTNETNNWDSNARRGTPSHGLFQFIRPTFESFAARARRANPQAWAGTGPNNWRDPRQQALTAAWAVANGLGHHWSTYRAALRS